MSYKKAMKHKPHRLRAGCFGFSTLAPNERRQTPWLGSAWEGKDNERAKFIKEWQAETERMLKENPNLKIV